MQICAGNNFYSGILFHNKGLIDLLRQWRQILGPAGMTRMPWPSLILQRTLSADNNRENEKSRNQETQTHQFHGI